MPRQGKRLLKTNPFTDWGFKRIFGQEVSKDILIRFLNVLLEGEHVIEDITFLNNEQNPETADNRTIIYDVYCTTDKGEHIIVEMQNRNQSNFIERTLYYMSAAIYWQGQRGTDWNYHIDAVYGVFFMNFKASGLDGQLRTDAELVCRGSGLPLTDKLRMIYLQLPYFEKEEEDCDTFLDCWIYTLKHMTTLDRMPFAARDAVFARLAQIGDLSSFTKEDHRKYDASIKFYRDTMAERAYARSEGLAEGRAEGLVKGLVKGEAKGRAEGIAEGEAKGEVKGKVKAICNMLGAGMSLVQAVSVMNEAQALIDQYPATEQ